MNGLALILLSHFTLQKYFDAAHNSDYCILMSFWQIKVPITKKRAP